MAFVNKSNVYYLKSNGLLREPPHIIPVRMAGGVYQRLSGHH